jgi:hypothetical protein
MLKKPNHKDLEDRKGKPLRGLSGNFTLEGGKFTMYSPNIYLIFTRGRESQKLLILTNDAGVAGALRSLCFQFQQSGFLGLLT